jgi:hypothetical protein
MADLRELQAKGVAPDNISMTYMKQLQHSFVSDPKQVPQVVDFCIVNIEKATNDTTVRRSKL